MGPECQECRYLARYLLGRRTPQLKLGAVSFQVSRQAVYTAALCPRMALWPSGLAGDHSFSAQRDKTVPALLS